MKSRAGAFCRPAFLAAVAASCLWPAPPAGAAALVKGLASSQGKLQSGVAIYALATPDFAPGKESRAMMLGMTDDDGRFSLPLPEGKHYLVAFRKGNGKRPVFEPGDLYCFFSGNPVTANDGGSVSVAFNLTAVPSDGQISPGPSGVEGAVMFEGKPLGRCYLYAYQDASGDFHGMGFSVTPVGKEGRFKLRLPPGRYYLIARQRQAGGMYGPLGKNDKVGFYYANPVSVTEGSVRQVTLDVIRIQESVGGEEGAAPSVRGTVRDHRGTPLGDIYVLFYDNPETSGKPRLVSRKTGKDGAFRVELPRGVKYYLLARQSLGGPPEGGEFYGRYEDRERKAIPVAAGAPDEGDALEIVIGQYQAPPN